jgi:hypothetical protein
MDELDEQGGSTVLAGKERARYKLRRGSTDSGEGSNDEESEREMGASSAVGGREERSSTSNL